MLEKYLNKVRSGELHEDPHQIRVLEKLVTLGEELIPYNKKKGSLLNRFFHLQQPHGLYIWGDVGRGKSMLMDIFYDSIDIENKVRIHFHEFMEMIHAQLRIEKDLKKVAKMLAKRYLLICFDEFQVTDIADAMILGRLFKKLYKHGIVMVATSNRVPDELYKDGLNRTRFLPFIELLKEKNDVLALQSESDYRKKNKKPTDKLFIGERLEGREFLFDVFKRLTNSKIPYKESVKVSETRGVVFERTYENLLWTNFNELCERNLSAADYKKICEKYNIIFLSNLKQLSIDNTNLVRRFINFIDVAYEAKVEILISSEVDLKDIYKEEGKLSFEFKRTLSRLNEMLNN